MSDLRALLQEARDKCVNYMATGWTHAQWVTDGAIKLRDRIDAALAEPALEPVAWLIRTETPIGFALDILGKQADPAYPDAFPVYSATPPAIPDGWQLVPKEPTQNMWDEAKMITEAMIKNHTNLDLGLIYQTMLAAAPKLPTI